MVAVLLLGKLGIQGGRQRLHNHLLVAFSLLLLKFRVLLNLLGKVGRKATLLAVLVYGLGANLGWAALKHQLTIVEL